MSRDVRLYLEDIVEYASRILEYSEHMDFQGFLASKMAYDAILRDLEIIGEAAKNVPGEMRERYPHIEWRNIAGLRDVVAHEYYGLEDETIWSIVKSDVPSLLDEVRQVLDDENKRSERGQDYEVKQ